ncbi:hypothetical protein [uncultured Mycobacterium sp.]|uniref:hypothetical protein n=1 Tax=uncultured Mycobacterium sp. TaxID=171292 RepID=UPI0035CB5CEA
MRTKITAMSAELSGKGPHLQATGQAAASGLQAQDAENEATIKAVPADMRRDLGGRGAGVQAAGYGTGGAPLSPGPGQPQPPIDPRNPFVGDERFGRWEDIPPLPSYTGAHPPPLQPQYRPFPDGTPQKIGPTTGMYTPGKSWIGDIDPPIVQAQEEYRFRLAGTEATTTTRTIFENGQWHQQRWVQNVYEYQRNTSLLPGGDLGGLPSPTSIDRSWKPISLPQLATLSANNPDVTYYLPDGCGGTVNFIGGAAQGGIGLPRPPIMTRPR